MNWTEYFRHFLVLFSGSALAQAINLLSYPLLARLYSPAEYGLFALFIAICAIPAALACARFDVIIPTVRGASRFALLWVCLAAALLMATVTAALVGLYFRLWDSSQPAYVALLAGGAVFLAGFCSSASMLLMRHDRYVASSRAVVIRTAMTVAAQVGLAVAIGGAAGLILGYCIGFLAQAVALAVAARGLGWRRPRLRQMKAIVQRHRRQIAIDVPGTVIGAGSAQLLSVLLIALHGPRAAGVYAMASRITIVPMELFSTSLSQVFFQKAARAQEATGSFWGQMKLNLALMAVVVGAVVLAIWLFARTVVDIYLGPEWALVGDVLIILAPMLALRSMAVSVATTVFIIRRPAWLFLHNLAAALAQLVAFALALWGGLDLRAFLMVAATLLAIESASFILILVVAARRRHLGRAAPAGAADEARILASPADAG